MAIDPERLRALAIPPTEQTFSERDTILYALALGYGINSLDEGALRYCYEAKLQAAPTLPLVLAHPGFWMRDLDTGIDWRHVVHGEQELEIVGPIPVAGTVRSETRIVDVIDKGRGRGAIVVFDRSLTDASTGRPIANMRQTNLCRADGGFGVPGVAAGLATPLPERDPDVRVMSPTRSDAALLYRLCADPNPLHADPVAALAAGFERPILHGLATFGLVAHAIVCSACDYQAARLRALKGRFIAAMFPGDTLRTEIWRDGGRLSFRALAAERDTVVMRGTAILSPGGSS